MAQGFVDCGLRGRWRSGTGGNDPSLAHGVSGWAEQMQSGALKRSDAFRRIVLIRDNLSNLCLSGPWSLESEMGQAAEIGI